MFSTPKKRNFRYNSTQHKLNVGRSRMKTLITSISGTRGIVGETLTPELALQTGIAFGQFISSGTVIIGGDTRTSHDTIKSACISGLLSVGIDVIDIGRVPTPTVQQMIRHFKADGGMVITASHNPIIWNGIKLMSKNGSFLSNDEYDAYISFSKKPSTQLAGWEHQGQLRIENNALRLHIDHILANIDTQAIKDANLNVIIDPNNGAACEANVMLMDALDVSYDMINGKGNGRFSHNPEPLKENVTEIRDILKNGHYDIGFVQDADADRLVILDENGRFIGEDYSLAYCIDYILSQTAEDDKRVVVNLSTSNIINDISKRHGASITQTKIGEANVTEALRAQNAHVGGEGNGGIIYPKIGWGRDSLVGIVIALCHRAKSKKPVSETIASYPSYVMLREKFPLEKRDDVIPFLENVKRTFSDADINEDDGVKVMFDNAWIHVRPSNTEPIVRIFVEAPDEDQAAELLKKCRLDPSIAIDSFDNK